jgi:hypothetical protein
MRRAGYDRRLTGEPLHGEDPIRRGDGVWADLGREKEPRPAESVAAAGS